MKPVVEAAALIATLTWSTAMGLPASAQAPCEVSPQFRNSKIVIAKDQNGECYWATRSYPVTIDDPDHPGKKKSVYFKISPDREQIRKDMMQRRVLEEYAEFLSPLRLPRVLRLLASDCFGGPGDSPHYSPYLNQRWMNLCYGMMNGMSSNADYLAQNQDKLRLPTPVSAAQLKAGLFAAVLLHETGHALFDLLDVPMFGSEEDAADQMAGLIALQFGKDTARTVIKGFAYLWKASAMAGSDPGAAVDPNEKDPLRRCLQDSFCGYADTHGTASQRMYNVLCMAYGGHADWFPDFIASGWLPDDRKPHCRNEYNQAYKAFNKTVYRFLDPAQMEVVKARQWFQPSEMKEK
jgi:hypothetical protein